MVQQAQIGDEPSRIMFRGVCSHSLPAVMVEHHDFETRLNPTPHPITIAEGTSY
jgi:hypothetical protein